MKKKFCIELTNRKTDHELSQNQSVLILETDEYGEIEVMDMAKFTNSLFTGIGRCKAIGCGLLLVKRI